MTRQPLFTRLFKTVGNHKAVFFSACCCILINAAATLAPAEWGGQLVKDLLKKESLDNLLLMGALALLIFTVKFTVDYGRRFFMNYLGHLISSDLLYRFHCKLTELSPGFFKKHRTGDLLSRTTADISVMRSFLGGSMLSIINDPLIIILALIRLFILNWLFTLELLLIGSGIALLMHFAGNQLRNAARHVQISLGTLTARLQELLSSIETVKVFQREKYHNRLFAADTSNYREKARKATAIDAVFRPAVDFLGFIAALLILITGAVLINGKKMEIPELFTFLFYLGILSAPLNSISHMISQYKTAAAAGERYFEIIDTPAENLRTDLPELKINTGTITFKKLDFSYAAGNRVLHSINTVIPSCSLTAIVGPSGSGKSTLCKIIAGLLLPENGTVLIDGTDIAAVSLPSLRSHISFLPQHHWLLHGTIADNISYGNPAADNQSVYCAAEKAGVLEFAAKLPVGLDTIVTEGRSGLSGGQLQRIALARLLLRNTPVIILDEATSALDNSSEQQFLRVLDQLRNTKTVIVAAHRLSAAREADKVLVMDGGSIVEQGNHATLSAIPDSLYRKLVEAAETL